MHLGTSASQADSAGSIPVTRSDLRHPVHPALLRTPDLVPFSTEHGTKAWTAHCLLSLIGRIRPTS